MPDILIAILPLLGGWTLDLLLGDPSCLPHPVVWFGKMIAWGEHRLNKGRHRMLKGALLALVLIIFVFTAGWLLNRYLPILNVIIIFFCLAGTTLIGKYDKYSSPWTGLWTKDGNRWHAS